MGEESQRAEIAFYLVSESAANQKETLIHLIMNMLAKE